MSNNEYVKVDDLFKGKADKEERIPAGAWNNMQRLLEKASPIGGGMSSGNFSRYVALALLTLGMGAGAVTWQYKTDPYAFSSEDNASTNMDQTIGDAATGVATATANNKLNPQDKLNHQSGVGVIAANTTNSAAGAGSGAAGLAHNLNTDVTATNSPNGNSGKEVIQPSSTVARASVMRQSKKEQKANNAIAQALSAGSGQNQSVADNQNTSIHNGDVALASIDKNMYRPKAAIDSNYAAVVLDNKNKYVLTKDEQWYKETAKAVNEIHTTKHVVRNEETKTVAKVIIDTTKNIRYTRVQLAPLNSTDKLQLLAITSKDAGFWIKARPAKFLSNVRNNNAGRNANESESNVSLEPLSSYKVGSTTEQKGSFARRFYDVMNNYFSMQKPYYFGAAAGFNTSLGSPMQTGYHFSLGGYYELKERLSFGVELKYAHSNVLQKRIAESFNTYENQSSSSINGQTVYSATQNVKENSYQIKGISSFELPVTLRYQLSKLSLLGGLNASYIFPANYTALLNQNKEAAKAVTSLSPFTATSGSINTNDFRSRLGLGYTVGCIYDLSKNISLDLRMSQTLWNNVKGTSALSTNLYQQPTIQFSLFYFLGKKDKVIYMMSDRK
ncbi:hypothetical protein DBR32_13510 [Taibaiella sp. KBW10]|uniref:hypothetical protein n=1 Tax=Taibaiella sp. KBW10 TaxID=2153357 RepID=UPI000F58FDB8|nr:hypothetical protein [Taibaiella sp. KBW10]RQO30569.1 hypothetical protein DBR32_13510 [Taibaiella sp. KBW10]